MQYQKAITNVNQYLRILYGPSSIDRTQISRQTASEQLLLFQKDKLAWIYVKDVINKIEDAPIANNEAYYQAYYGASTLYWKIINEGDQLAIDDRIFLSNSIYACILQMKCVHLTQYSSILKRLCLAHVHLPLQNIINEKILSASFNAPFKLLEISSSKISEENFNDKVITWLHIVLNESNSYLYEKKANNNDDNEGANVNNLLMLEKYVDALKAHGATVAIFISKCVESLLQTNHISETVKLSNQKKMLNCINTWILDGDISPQCIAESTNLIQIALSLNSIENVELLENLILNYSRYELDYYVHKQIVEGIHILHLKWLEMYTKQQQVHKLSNNNMNNDSDQHQQLYYSLEKILGRAYLSIDEAYAWLKDLSKNDDSFIRLKMEMVQFNISNLSNKIHSFENANMALTFFDNFGDNPILTQQANFYDNFIQLLVNACSMLHLCYLEDFNFEGLDEVEAFHFFRSHARETMLLIASSWTNVNAYKCLQSIVSLLNNIESTESAESIFWLLHELDDACNTIDGDDENINENSIRTDESIQLWTQLYTGILSLPSFQQPITMLRSIYQLIEKNNDSVICYFNASTIIQQLIELLIKELYYQPHQSVQVHCARALYYLLSNVKICKKLNQECDVTFIHDVVIFFIEKENANNNVNIEVRRYIYCSIVSLIKYYYSNTNNNANDGSVIMGYLKCIFSSMCNRLKSIASNANQCSTAPALHSAMESFFSEMNLINDILSTMAYDINIIEDDNYNVLLVIQKMEHLYTTCILDDVIFSVLKLVSETPTITSNKLYWIKMEQQFLKLYLHVIEASGMAIFQLKTLEIIFTNTMKIFNDNHSNASLKAGHVETLNMVQKSTIENYSNILKFSGTNNITACSNAISRVYEFVWALNSYLMPNLSHFIFQYQQQGIGNNDGMPLLPSVDSYTTFLSVIDEITYIPLNNSRLLEFSKLNDLLLNGLNLSMYMLEYICVLCKSNYQRLQRDQIGRKIINTYIRIYEYYIQCNLLCGNNFNMELLNKNLEITLNKLLLPAMWNKLTVILQNNIARLVHSICGNNDDNNENNRSLVSEFLLAKNQVLQKIFFIGGGMNGMPNRIVPRRKLLKFMKKYVKSL